MKRISGKVTAFQPALGAGNGATYPPSQELPAASGGQEEEQGHIWHPIQHTAAAGCVLGLDPALKSLPSPERRLAQLEAYLGH